jgi:hypothetical protein
MMLISRKNFLRFWRTYHYSQKAIVLLDVIFFFGGCYLLSLYSSFPPVAGRKIEGNLEQSFDSCEAIPDLILGMVVPVICIPFIGIGGVALRNRPIIQFVSFCRKRIHTASNQPNRDENPTIVFVFVVLYRYCVYCTCHIHHGLFGICDWKLQPYCEMFRLRRFVYSSCRCCFYKSKYRDLILDCTC